MAGSQRTITPILIIQAATLVLATGGSIAWTITELRDWHSQVDVPQRTVRDIESHVQAAIIAPYNYLGTGDTRAEVKASKATAEAQASLRVGPTSNRARSDAMFVSHRQLDFRIFWCARSVVQL